MENNTKKVRNIGISAMCAQRPAQRLVVVHTSHYFSNNHRRTEEAGGFSGHNHSVDFDFLLYHFYFSLVVAAAFHDPPICVSDFYLGVRSRVGKQPDAGPVGVNV